MSASASTPAPSLTVRPARADDAETIETLIGRYVPDGTLLPRSAAFVRLNAEDFLVAMAEDQIVGCVNLDEYSPSIAELRSLAVDPAWRGKGVGRVLVHATEQLARKRDNDVLFAVSNDEEFFRQFGFARWYVPELDLERSEVSRYKGVYAKALTSAGMPPWLPTRPASVSA